MLTRPRQNMALLHFHFTATIFVMFNSYVLKTKQLNLYWYCKEKIGVDKIACMLGLNGLTRSI